MRHCWSIWQKASRSLEAVRNKPQIEQNRTRHTGSTNMHASPFDGYNKPFDSPCVFSVLNEYSDDDPRRSRFYTSFAEPRGAHTSCRVRTLTARPALRVLRVQNSTPGRTSDTSSATMQARFGPSARLLSPESNSIYAEADLLAG